MKKLRCQAKILGTLVTVGGAMLMTLYKGPIVELPWSKQHFQTTSDDDVTANKNWFKGSIFLIIATLAWASLFVLQVLSFFLLSLFYFVASRSRKKTRVLFRGVFRWIGSYSKSLVNKYMSVIIQNQFNVFCLQFTVLVFIPSKLILNGLKTCLTVILTVSTLYSHTKNQFCCHI